MTINTQEQKITILVVEDDRINQIVILDVIQQLGYGIADLSKTAMEAIEKISQAETPYDLVLLDIGLPDYDGVMLTQMIRGLETVERSGVPIIAVTGHAQPRNIQIFKDAGINAVIGKPVNRDILDREIKNVLNGETSR